MYRETKYFGMGSTRCRNSKYRTYLQLVLSLYGDVEIPRLH